MSEFDLLRQSVAEVVAYCEAKYKRPRAEEAAEVLHKRVCSADLGTGAAFGNFYSKGDHDQRATEILPIHHQQFHQGAQSSDQRNFDQARKTDVPNVKQACAEESDYVSSRDCGGPGGSESFQVNVTFDKLTVSAEISRPLNQSKTFVLNVSRKDVDSALSAKCEFRRDQGL